MGWVDYGIMGLWEKKLSYKVGYNSHSRKHWNPQILANIQQSTHPVGMKSLSQTANWLHFAIYDKLSYFI